MNFNPNSPRRKNLFIILGGLLVLILAIVLISNAVEEKKRTTVLGAIPDPEVYFGVSGEHDRYESSTWRQHSIKFNTADVSTEIMNAYIELLSSNAYPFVLDDTVEYSGTVSYLFVYNGAEKLYDAQVHQIQIKYDPWEKEISINILNSNNFELVPIEPYGSGSASPGSQGSAAVPAPKPVSPAVTPSQKTETVDPTVLPDFLEHDSSGSFYQDTTSSPNVVAFIAPSHSVRDVTEDYVQLLLDMGYYVSDTEEKSYLYRWYLTHDDVDGSTVEGTAQVCVKHMTYTSFDKNKTEVSITFGSGVSYEGDSKTSSASSSGSGSGGSNSSKTPCSICNRSGDCQTCGGDGYLWSSASGKEDRNCYSCMSSNGKCTNCNGKGWLD